MPESITFLEESTKSGKAGGASPVPGTDSEMKLAAPSLAEPDRHEACLGAEVMGRGFPRAEERGEVGWGRKA